MTHDVDNRQSATAKSGERSVRLLQFSDTHLHAAADSRMRGVTTYRTFLDTLAQSQDSPDWPPDAILVTGDIVQDESRAGYERFVSTLMPFGIPVLCLPGNHDDPALMEELLVRPPFQFGGTARFDGWSVVLLNTFLMGEDAGGLGAQRLNALQKTLREQGDQHVLIALHHHPLPMGSTWLDGVGLRDADEFLRVIEAHSNVRCVLWGHVHQASDRKVGNVRFLSTPSTCSQFLPGSEFFALDERPPGMRWLQLQPGGGIVTRVEWVSRKDTA